MPLLEGLDGVEKMSKSKNNYIGITEAANTMFGKLMSISDVMMWRYFELLSFSSLADIAALKAEVDAGRNPRDAKVALCKEIVTRFHSAQAADDALADFVNRSKGGMPDDAPELALAGAPMGIAHLIKLAGLCASTSEAMRMVDQGAVRINGEVVSDKAMKIEAGKLALQVGKRKAAHITFSA
jgi:tyrosyl-tRNA synthetase